MPPRSGRAPRRCQGFLSLPVSCVKGLVGKSANVRGDRWSQLSCSRFAFHVVLRIDYLIPLLDKRPSHLAGG